MVLNHRSNSPAAVYDKLFEDIKFDPDTLKTILVKGAVKMKEKLSSYAHDQLPGGKFWDPDTQVRGVLSQLKPSNDVCESILSLNDYLTTHYPIYIKCHAQI